MRDRSSFLEKRIFSFYAKKFSFSVFFQVPRACVPDDPTLMMYMRQDQVDTQNGSYNQQQQQQPQPQAQDLQFDQGGYSGGGGYEQTGSGGQQQSYVEEQSYNAEPQQQQQPYQTLESQEPVQQPVQYVSKFLEIFKPVSQNF